MTERAIKKQFTARRGRQAMLVIDHQSFCINGECETVKHAEWMRNMLAKALARMLSADYKETRK